VTLKDAGKQIWVAMQASDVGRLRTLCDLWGDNKDVTNWANPEAVDFGGGLKIAGSTALHLAASHPGTVKALKLLVSMPSIDINIVSAEGLSPLFVAVWKNRVDSVRVLSSLPGIKANLAERHHSVVQSSFLRTRCHPQAAPGHSRCRH
jgi:ankyrin repeat protein